MADYFYYQGEIRVKPEHLEECFSRLFQTEFIDKDEKALRRKGNFIVLDTLERGSYPLSQSVEFEKELKKCVPFLMETTEIEHYLYNDGYYRIHLDPRANTFEKNKVSNEDPYSSKVSEGELIQQIEAKLQKEPSVEAVVRTYQSQIKKLLGENKQVDTGLGVFRCGIKQRGERTARNPQTGEIVVMPARKTRFVSLRGKILPEGLSESKEG